MKSSTKKPPKNPKGEVTLNISTATYRKQLAQGLDPDSLLKPVPHRFRRSRHTIKPGEHVMVNSKARVTMYLDADIVECFRVRGAHYQTEINAALRRIVDAKRIEQALVSD
ncbi:MAG: BrnA antitoxin family protein [Pyrinomonadaceae bacterium]|nr:BrnA antitoxin family protein [Pyrinomonadaceae bacterium]